MKQYFCKYLPVEGEVNEFDIILLPNHGLYQLNGEQDVFKARRSKWSKVKLFLCSRNIQMGDKCLDLLSGEEFVAGPHLHEMSDFIREQSLRVIGEISRDALSYVKEGDEFDEDQVQLNLLDVDNQGNDLYICYIKGPCGHFH